MIPIEEPAEVAKISDERREHSVQRLDVFQSNISSKNMKFRQKANPPQQRVVRDLTWNSELLFLASASEQGCQ